MSDENDQVGYRRPPVATRFKKGQSGNPSGKRKARLTPSQRLDKILAEIVPVTEGGKSKRMDREEIFLRQTVSRAIAGDRQCSPLVLNYLLRRQASSGAEDTSATDEFLVAELEKMMRGEDSK